jgi:ribosomal protein S18 acetylase RimI-like enzyme
VIASIERLNGPPADCLGPLIAESEAHGLRFVRRLADEWTSGINRFERPGETRLVAAIGERIVGVCGLNVDPYAARPDVGRVRHLYVLGACRRLGVGEQLVTAVIEAARGKFERLRLRTENPAAARLYERLGFQRQLDVPDCTHIMDLRPGSLGSACTSR